MAPEVEEVLRRGVVRLKILSPTQKKVVLLAVVGEMSKSEIATKLGKSFHTIDTHFRKLYLKLGVHSLDQLIEKVAEAGQR